MDRRGKETPHKQDIQIGCGVAPIQKRAKIFIWLIYIFAFILSILNTSAPMDTPGWVAFSELGENYIISSCCLKRELTCSMLKNSCYSGHRRAA